MSVTFTTRTADGELAGGYLPDRLEPCLCTQMAPNWPNSSEAELRENVDPECYSCEGTGIEEFPGLPVLSLNLSNGNAAALLSLLGLPDEYGDITIPQARRAIMRARATSKVGHTRAPRTEYGKPRLNEDGTYDLRPVRVFAAGLDEEGLEFRLELLADLVEKGAKAGAVTLHWG